MIAGNPKGESITVLLTSRLTGFDWSVLQITTKIVSYHTADSKPVKLEVNSTVILPPLVFPDDSIHAHDHFSFTTTSKEENKLLPNTQPQTRLIVLYLSSL
jgi:hypothetical protein